MSSSALLRLEALRKCNTDPNWVNADLYRLLYKTDLYVVAYEKIKSAPVCRECHRKIHRGEYDGLRLTDLAYRIGP
jgi:hypothetical protein